MRELRVWVAMVLCLLGAVTTATAGVIAYDNMCDGCTNQNFGNSLGLDFEVNSAIDVLALGMYNGGNNNEQYIYGGQNGSEGHPGSGVWVLIYKIDSPGCTTCNGGSPMVPVASVFFDPNNFDITKPGYGEGDQINSETFQNLSSAVELLPGYYSVVTFNDWNWNEYNPYPQTEGSPSITLNDGGGLITFDGSGRYDPTNSCQYFPGPGCSSSYFDFPTTVDSGPADRYMAGSFIFEDAKIPEPSTVGLICAGLAGVWVLRRRRA